MESNEQVRLALTAVNQALEQLGSAPIFENPMFQEERTPGRLTYMLETPPLRFHFGQEFEVGLGSVAEIYTVLPSDASTLQEDITRILTSSFNVDEGSRHVKVELVDREGKVWLRSRQCSLFGRYRPKERLAQFYPPAFPVPS